MASARVLCRAMNNVAMQYTGKALNPAAVNMDCSDKFRAGVLAEWPMAREGPDSEPHPKCALTSHVLLYILIAQESSPVGPTSRER